MVSRWPPRTCELSWHYSANKIRPVLLSAWDGWRQMPNDDPKVTNPPQPASSRLESLIGQAFDHYTIIEPIGEGGMGIVYKALDSHLDRFVAVKTLRASAAANEDRKRRFAQEAKSASALNHPNIIHIYDIGNSNNIDFIAMEYVQGKTLDQLMGRNALPINEALKYAIQ